MRKFTVARPSRAAVEAHLADVHAAIGGVGRDRLDLAILLLGAVQDVDARAGDVIADVCELASGDARQLRHVGDEPRARDLRERRQGQRRQRVVIDDEIRTGRLQGAEVQRAERQVVLDIELRADGNEGAVVYDRQRRIVGNRKIAADGRAGE